MSLDFSTFNTKLTNFAKGVGYLLLGIVSLIVIFGMIDWGSFSSEITSYGIICTDALINGRCLSSAYSSGSNTYKVNADNNQVIDENYPGGPEKLKDCAVVNRENWKCHYSDGSGPIGFTNGIYFSEWDRTNELDNSLFGKTIYVPKYRSFIFQWTGLWKP